MPTASLALTLPLAAVLLVVAGLAGSMGLRARSGSLISISAMLAVNRVSSRSAM